MFDTVFRMIFEVKAGTGRLMECWRWIDTKNIIELGSTGANDNLCEKINNQDCNKCEGCSNQNNYFQVSDFGEYFIVSYHYKIGELVIERYSERINKVTLEQC
jgi:hypothetical protein